jgi:hypothetical protein
MTQTAGSGRYNDRAGRAWETACARALTDSGHFPSAAPMPRGTPGDLSGTWDVSVECTVSPWSKMWQKMGQASHAAAFRGLPYWCVWRKRNQEPGLLGSTDPMDGAVLTSPRVWWHVVARLEAYERAEMDAEREYERGYRDGARGRAIEAAAQ